MNNITVCELSDYAPPFYGNFMYSLLNLEETLKKRNLNNKVIYAFYENSKECNWIKEMRQNNKTVFLLKSKYLRGFIQLKKIIKNNNVNIIHSHFTVPIIIFLLIKISFPKLKIIVHFHNYLSALYEINYYKKMPIAILKKYLYNINIINYFCGCSESVLINIVNCGIRKEKCCYIDNCIDFSRLKNNISNIDKIDIKLFDNKNIFFIYGTHYHRKGVDIAINAIKNIADNLNIILFIICQNINYVKDEVINLIGYIPDWIQIRPSIENITDYLNITNIYLTPSREEGFSYLMLEAIYCDNIVIRSDLSAMNRNLPNDFVVPVNDSDALRQCIEYVLLLPAQEKKAIVSEQKDYIMQRWNIDIWSNSIINMYFNLLDK